MTYFFFNQICIEHLFILYYIIVYCILFLKMSQRGDFLTGVKKYLIYTFFNVLFMYLFTFCFVSVHLHLLCYFFHPYVLFITFIKHYFVFCHIEISFSFEYLHSAVNFLPVVYLPVYCCVDPEVHAENI